MSDLVYHALYRLLFVVHAVFAAYVAGGTLWLTVRGLRKGADEDPIAATLRDWLPFVLGLAITFGVGPLLFIQLIDGSAFYTANLLLSHRFMALLPALIAGFYLLYVQKTGWRWVGSRAGRLLVPLAAFLCFGFTAWSWSENHLLAQSPEVWPDVYVRQPGFFGHGELPFRLLVFAGFALQSVAVLVAAQSRALRADTGARRHLGLLAMLGAVAVLTGLLLHPTVEGVSLLGWTGAVILLAGAVVVAASLRALLPATIVALTVLAERLTALRETVRIARGGADELAETASAQGFVMFCATLALVAVAVTWSVLRVRSELRAS